MIYKSLNTGLPSGDGILIDAISSLGTVSGEETVTSGGATECSGSVLRGGTG